MREAAMVALLGFGLSTLAPRVAQGADTTEAWDIGATNYEYYQAYEGIGLVPEDQLVATEAVAGFGLLPRLSGGFGATLQGNSYLAAPEVDVGAWLFATLYEGDHADLDFTFTTAVGGPGLSELRLVPGVELNLDSQPDLSGFGVYFRFEETLGGEETTLPPAAPAEEPEPSFERTYEIAGLVGTYVSPASGHQILAEFDAAVAHGQNTDQRPTVGALALGYNVWLTDRLELITEIAVDLPQDDEVASMGVSAGMIVTLPGGA